MLVIEPTVIISSFSQIKKHFLLIDYRTKDGFELMIITWKKSSYPGVTHKA